jgi:hypothetical protein
MMEEVERLMFDKKKVDYVDGVDVVVNSKVQMELLRL